MDREDRSYEPMPDHYGTGRQPYRKKSLFSLTLLLFALLVGANLVSLAFMMGYNVGRKQQELENSPSTRETATTANTQLPDLSALSAKLRESLAELHTQEGSHTGIVLSSNGYILTTAPCENLQQVTVGGKTYTKVQIKGSAPELGLTVLRVDARALQPVTMGLCGMLSSPEELLLRCTAPLSAGASPEWIRQIGQSERSVGGTSRRILEGNYTAGDLLLNEEGQLVALCVPTAEGVMALSMEEIINLAGELLAFGSLDSPLSPGVEISLLDEAQSLYWDLPGNLMISRIQEGGRAQAAGLREGDVLLEIAGISINSPTDLWQAIDACRENRSVILKIYRGSEELELRLELGGDDLSPE